MEAGGKDCEEEEEEEEEALQTAFKKLRVDAGSLPGAVSAVETPRGCQDAGGEKPKDNWHGSMRKTSRGPSRTHRRRRSKSPILQPPTFPFCSAAPSPPSGGLKLQRLTAPEPRPPAAARTELPPSGAAGRVPPLVFGSRAAVQEAASTARDGGRRGGGVRPAEDGAVEDGARGRAEAAAAQTPGHADDFRALSESPDAPCSCDGGEGGGRGARAPCRCRLLPLGWRAAEVYAFTGRRGAERQRSASLRTVGTNGSAASSAGSASSSCSSPSSSSSSSSSAPRSCWEQARSPGDDVTMEDLSGYMEFYLFLPQKMSRMAEMMYT